MDLAPNAKTYATVLDACASVGAIETGQHIHSLINPSMLKGDAVIGTAMINLYARSGMIDLAKRLFDSVVTRDPVAWSSMIAAFAQNGHSCDALDLFREMTDEKEISPDAITFLGVLAACSHGGLIDHGIKQFVSMIQEFEIKPAREHFGCVIDLLARTGRISDAIELLYAMPCVANEVVWTSVMNACRIHGDMEQGMVAAEEVMMREPENPEAYIAMAGFLVQGRLHELTLLTFTVKPEQPDT
ncbi:pentatricopeptide repeat-containing protein At4g14820-like [Selaginella moellendorffii]|uniref:pentatricopeptide repeat-containing protein At4g14820-like n=1 Tax=Selaginella moellendorffii TaxID=88036 RepID=UPI000D1CB43C|nr:pentatricopeptide repeat-containing protein At4g14820-like [Selaginella moellendorffii]|eukprot:XP_024525459.1 pentatricopeptide repeat-containing protein At4g14820-like [Selaginella moellendorffii]